MFGLDSLVGVVIRVGKSAIDARADRGTPSGPKTTMESQRLACVAAPAATATGLFRVGWRSPHPYSFLSLVSVNGKICLGAHSCYGTSVGGGSAVRTRKDLRARAEQTLRGLLHRAVRPTRQRVARALHSDLPRIAFA